MLKLAAKLEHLANETLGDLQHIRDRYRENSRVLNDKARLFEISGELLRVAEQLRAAYSPRTPAPFCEHGKERGECSTMGCPHHWSERRESCKQNTGE
jgi:hypothetical protein